MGLLFTLEGDDEAKGHVLDLSANAHHQWISKARELGGFPLVRRTSDFYRDADFEKDEIPPLQAELQKLNDSLKNEQIQKFIDLCFEAIEHEKGVQAIAD